MKSGYDPEVHRRRSIRLKGYDYSRPGAYFVTIVAQDRLCWFGDVVDGEMRLNKSGELIVDAWEWLGERYPHVALDAYVVMPNHLHGVVVLTDEEWGGESGGGVSGRHGRRGVNVDRPVRRGVSRNAPTVGSGMGVDADGSGMGVSRTAPTGRKTLGRLVGAFKTVSTKGFNRMRGMSGERLWQRDFYDRVIRDDRELDLVRRYIEGNPAKWETDEENPNVANV